MPKSKPRRAIAPTAPKPKPVYAVQRLLYSREQAGHALGGVSISTIIRLEREGVLTPIKLLPEKTNAQTFYRVEEIEALATAGEA